MSFIKDFYYGDIIPGAKGFYENKEYTNALRCFDKSKKRLTDALSEEEQMLFNDFWEKECKFTLISEFENFKLGFRLGAQMMCDCLSDENK